MKILGAITIIVILIMLCIITLKIVSWMIEFDKKTDIKMFDTELEDYKSDKQCATAVVIIIFLVIMCGLLYLYFSRW